jgi:hypothetical protein
MRDVWDRLLDFAVATKLGVIDRVLPRPETPVDRAIREEGERPRKAVPWIDERERRPPRLKGNIPPIDRPLAPYFSLPS